MSSVTIKDWQKLRSELLDTIASQENGDDSIKFFRVHPTDANSKIISVTIQTKTKLGACIVFMDWCLHKTDMPDYWGTFVDEFSEGNYSIQRCAKQIIKDMFEGCFDYFLVEISEDVSLTLSM